MVTGLILGVPSNRDGDDFAVLQRVTGNEKTPIDVSNAVAYYMSTGRLRCVWFQEVKVPE